jgi:glycine/D-amino acid oxidase-like deaminating enzyme
VYDALHQPIRGATPPVSEAARTSSFTPDRRGLTYYPFVDVIVVGAGIVGTCVAYALARGGASVTLVEEGTPGGGASATSYAWLNSNSFDDAVYHALRVRGMAAYRELEAELGTGDWLHLTGSVRVAFAVADAKAVRERVARKRAVGYPAELLDAGCGLPEPALARLIERPAAVAHFPGEGYIDTATLIGDLLHAFAGLGGVLVRAHVYALLRDGSVKGVRTSTHGDITGDRVVLCTGADTSLLSSAGFRLAARGPVGATVVTAPVPVRLNGLVHFPDVTIRPDGGGRLLLHADDIDERVDTDTMTLDETAIGELTGRARRWLRLPDGDVRVSEVGVSFRPYPPDGFPVAGPVPGLPGAYVVCTHSGVTLGAILGHLVAREHLTSTPDPSLAPYRPTRLT